MHLAHMLNHLIPPRKPLVPTAMAALDLTVEEFDDVVVVRGLDVALEVGFAGEADVVGGARVEETVVPSFVCCRGGRRRLHGVVAVLLLLVWLLAGALAVGYCVSMIVVTIVGRRGL